MRKREDVGQEDVKRMRTLNKAHRTKLRLYNSPYVIDVFIFKTTRAMRNAIRHFFYDVAAAKFHAHQTVGLTVFRYTKKKDHLACFVFLAAPRADVETISHEATHVIGYTQSEIAGESLDFTKHDPHERFAKNVGKLSQDMFNAVHRFKVHYGIHR